MNYWTPVVIIVLDQLLEEVMDSLLDELFDKLFDNCCNNSIRLAFARSNGVNIGLTIGQLL